MYNIKSTKVEYEIFKIMQNAFLLVVPLIQKQNKNRQKNKNKTSFFSTKRYLNDPLIVLVVHHHFHN